MDGLAACLRWQSPVSRRMDGSALSESLRIPLKVLLYLSAKHGENTYAKEIENDLQLKKATVSYNLHILEEHNLIDRDESILQKDQRLKSIKITPTGIQVLLNIYQSLIGIFPAVVS